MTYEERRDLYEEWVDLEDFPNHQVSSFGRVRNKRNGYILKPFADRYGYLRLSIGNVDNVPVHRLVCEAFYGPPEGEANCVNHIDCDRQNNHALNLHWCTPRENTMWAIYKGNLDPMKGLARAAEVNPKPVRLVEINMEFPSVKACAEYLGVNPNRVSRCLVGARKGQKLHGYHVEFIREENA